MIYCTVKKKYIIIKKLKQTYPHSVQSKYNFEFIVSSKCLTLLESFLNCGRHLSSLDLHQRAIFFNFAMPIYELCSALAPLSALTLESAYLSVLGNNKHLFIYFSCSFALFSLRSIFVSNCSLILIVFVCFCKYHELNTN